MVLNAMIGSPRLYGTSKPNIVLVMSDDQGWGDVGYRGRVDQGWGNVIHWSRKKFWFNTSEICRMSDNGLRFERFYASPICSPTRAAVLTGRCADRTGVIDQGEALRLQERSTTIAYALRHHAGYATGHFGKWHLDGMHAMERGGGGPIDREHTHNPGVFGFETWLSNFGVFELNPMLSRNGEFEGFYGDSSDVLAEQALRFIGQKAASGIPSFTAVWYSSPHDPWVNLNKDRQPYYGLWKSRYYGEIHALDRSLGTLRRGLRTLGIENNTLLWFCSDNGGTSMMPRNTAGGLRGFKKDLWEGGVRVPAIIEWPGVISPRVTWEPGSVVDIFPTIAEIVGLPQSSMLQPQDGESLVHLFSGDTRRRLRPIRLSFKGSYVLIDYEMKIKIWHGKRWGHPNVERFVNLFNLRTNPTEDYDILHPNRFNNSLKRVNQSGLQRVLDQMSILIQNPTLDYDEELRHKESRARQHLDLLVEEFYLSINASQAGMDYPEKKVIPPPKREVDCPVIPGDNHTCTGQLWLDLELYRPHRQELLERPEYGHYRSRYSWVSNRTSSAADNHNYTEMSRKKAEEIIALGIGNGVLRARAEEFLAHLEPSVEEFLAHLGSSAPRARASQAGHRDNEARTVQRTGVHGTGHGHVAAADSAAEQQRDTARTSTAELNAAIEVAVDAEDYTTATRLQAERKAMLDAALGKHAHAGEGQSRIHHQSPKTGSAMSREQLSSLRAAALGEKDVMPPASRRSLASDAPGSTSSVPQLAVEECLANRKAVCENGTSTVWDARASKCEVVVDGLSRSGLVDEQQRPIAAPELPYYKLRTISQPVVELLAPLTSRVVVLHGDSTVRNMYVHLARHVLPGTCGSMTLTTCVLSRGFQRDGFWTSGPPITGRATDTDHGYWGRFGWMVARSQNDTTIAYVKNWGPLDLNALKNAIKLPALDGRIADVFLFNAGAHMLHVIGGVRVTPHRSAVEGALHHESVLAAAIHAYRNASARTALIWRTTNSICEGNWGGDRAWIVAALRCQPVENTASVCANCRNFSIADRYADCEARYNLAPRECYASLLVQENSARQREISLRVLSRNPDVGLLDAFAVTQDHCNLTDDAVHYDAMLNQINFGFLTAVQRGIAAKAREQGASGWCSRWNCKSPCSKPPCCECLAA